MFDRWYRWMVVGFDWTAKLVIQPINDWFTIWLKQFWGKTDSECWLFSLKGKNFPIIGEFPRTTSGILLQEKKTTRSSIANHGRKRTTQSCANQIPRPRTPNIFHHIFPNQYGYFSDISSVIWIFPNISSMGYHMSILSNDIPLYSPTSKTGGFPTFRSAIWTGLAAIFGQAHHGEICGWNQSINDETW